MISRNRIPTPIVGGPYFGNPCLDRPVELSMFILVSTKIWTHGDLLVAADTGFMRLSNSSLTLTCDLYGQRRMGSIT